MKHFYNIYSLLIDKEKKTLSAMLFIVISLAILEMTIVGLTIPLMDLFTSQSEDNYIKVFINYFFVIENHNLLVIIALLIYLFIFLTKNILTLFLQWFQARFANFVKARISVNLLTYYLRKPFAFHLNKNSSELIRNTFSEVGTVVGAGVQPMIQILAESLVVVGLLLILIVIEPTGSVIMMIITSFFLYLVFYFLKKNLYLWGKQREFHDGKRIQHLQQAIQAVKDIKIFGGEKEFVDQYNHHNLQSIFAEIKHATVLQLPRLAVESIMVLLVVTYITVMIYKGVSLEDLASVLIIFSVAAFRLIPSANRIITALQAIKYGMPAVETIYSDLKDFDDNYSLVTPSTGDYFKPLAFSKNFLVKDLKYSYANSNKKVVLSEVNFEIKKGDRVAIIGKSGSGKSTLLNIILGLLKSSSGSIKADGVDINSNISSWRKKFSVVPQEIFLIDSTISKNIAFGRNDLDINDKLVMDAIIKSELKNVIDELPDKLNTIVGERGIRFSGGQMQRIGLARAIYNNPEILVLDEATSSLDIETEHNIMNSIYGLSSDLTIIIVTHRESTIFGCNKVLSLNNGVIEKVIK